MRALSALLQQLPCFLCCHSTVGDMLEACHAHHVSAVRHQSAFAADTNRASRQLPFAEIGAHALIVLAMAQAIAGPRCHGQSSISPFPGVLALRLDL